MKFLILFPFLLMMGALACTNSTSITTPSPPTLTALPPLPSMDMQFEELKTFSQAIEYDELYRNMDQYSLETWRKTGGPPPLLYFSGSVVKSTKQTGIMEGLWSAVISIGAADGMVITYEEPILRSGDSIEFITVCHDLKPFESTFVDSQTLPNCAPWKIKIVN